MDSRNKPLSYDTLISRFQFYKDNSIKLEE